MRGLRGQAGFLSKAVLYNYSLDNVEQRCFDLDLASNVEPSGELCLGDAKNHDQRCVQCDFLFGAATHLVLVGNFHSEKVTTTALA